MGTDAQILTELGEFKYALNTLYLLFSGILVMWMAAGFAMLEAGLVRAKNTTEILTKNIALYAISSITYLVVGYQLMYSAEPINAWFPNLGFWPNPEGTLAELDPDNASYANYADFFFQVVFVATSMSIVSGAVAERMKLSAFLLFSIIFTALIYPIQGYWKWGGGILDQIGFFDYAGSGVVHMAGAAAALAAILLLGARKGKYNKNGEANAIPGCNLPLATIGMLILWMGWFGFNGGSELAIASFDSANNVAKVMVNTNTAAASGLIMALFTAKLLFRKADLTFALNGALAGLVVITADPLSPSVTMSLLSGALGGLLVVFAILAFDKVKLDDPVGALSVHGVAGILGLLLVPISNADASLSAQLTGIGAIFGFVFVSSFIVWSILKDTIGIRVEAEHEYIGADISECGLTAYPEFTAS
jgi:Amt family ammonium transporter